MFLLYEYDIFGAFLIISNLMPIFLFGIFRDFSPDEERAVETL